MKSNQIKSNQIKGIRFISVTTCIPISPSLSLQASNELLDLKDDMITDLLAELATHTKALQGNRNDFEAVLEQIELEKAVSAEVSWREECARVHLVKI
jgi:hypothetical protein